MASHMKPSTPSVRVVWLADHVGLRRYAVGEYFDILFLRVRYGMRLIKPECLPDTTEFSEFHVNSFV